MIYACTITFSTHGEIRSSDTEGRFTILCEAADSREVIEKILPAKLKAVAELGQDYAEFYLISMIELVVPLRGSLLFGFVEHPLRLKDVAATDTNSDFVLPEDSERARTSKHSSVSQEIPVFTHGRLPQRLVTAK